MGLSSFSSVAPSWMESGMFKAFPTGFPNRRSLNRSYDNQDSCSSRRGMPLFGKVKEDLKLKHIETTSYPSGFVKFTIEV